MDDRSANALRQDPFAAADALLSNGMPGESLFVINLCAANMPQAIDASSVRAWGIEGLETYKLYQVSRLEDGRTRYRVRLGFFTSEADAEAVLRSIRGKFATAFTSGLCDEDLKHASGYLKKPLNEIREIQDIQRTGRYRIPNFAAEGLQADTSATGRQPIPKAPVVPATIARAANAMLSEGPATVPAKQTAAKSHEEHVEIEWAPDHKLKSSHKAADKAASKAMPKPATKTAAPLSVTDKWAAFAQNAKTNGNTGAQPVAKEPVKHKPSAAPVAKAAPATTPPKKPVMAPHVELTASVPPKAAPAPTPRAPNRPFHVASGQSIPDHGFELTDDPAAPMVKAAPAPVAAPPSLPRPLVSAEALSKLRAAAAQPRNGVTVVPTLDTTQTIRTLTKTEIEDANAPKWFVVQLAVSEQPANLDTMPRLDIFEAYRLYSVATMQNNIIRHALRLGFFSEKVSAEAVMGYLKTFFGDPVIEQISDAEQKRFAEPPPDANNAVDPMKTQAAQARVITLEEKRPVNPLVFQPATNSYEPVAVAPVKPVPAKTANKAATPAVKRSPPLPGKKGGLSHPTGKYAAHKVVAEARALGLSDTTIRKVEANPSLLSRFVSKLTK